MLDAAVRFLADEINAYFRKRSLAQTGVGEVILGHLVDDAGKWATEPDNIGLTLVNIEEDRVLRAQLPDHGYLKDQHVVLQPELRLHLTLLFHVRHKPGNYEQSLRFLANVLTFFQAHPVFTPQAYPALDARIGKLTVEMLSLGSEQLNQMWAYLGSKYLPSVVYRVRMVVLQDSEPQTIAKPIGTVDMELHAR